MRITLLSLILICLASPGTLVCQQPPKPDYASLLERVMKSDPTVDFAALRYARFDNPPKESSVSPDAERKMFAALQIHDFEQALKFANEVISGNFVNIEAHMVASIAYKNKNDDIRQKFHAYVADGLVNSILKSGDGKSPATAYVVISTEEEYTVLRTLGLAPGIQSLLHIDGHDFDRLDAKDGKTGNSVQIYFNIDRPFGALQKLFGK